jgi:redox-sensitive bicupin YhaK (pirin superfamily)
MERRHFIKGSAVLGMTLVGNTALIGASGMYANKEEREIYRIITASGVNVGTLPVMRAFAGDQNDYVSPYLLFDEFGPVEVDQGTDGFKVEAHPHAGVTPTTYFVSGTGHHKDSLDYDFQIGKGDFMMFSSGKGAIHMEQSGKLMKEEGGVVHGFQIWLNTPKKYKWDTPSTVVHRTKHMDKIEGDGYEIQVVLGELGDACSNVELLSSAFYYHVKMDKDKRLDIPTDPNHNAFIYAVDASLELADTRQLRSHQLALYQRGKSVIRLYAKEASEFLILGGQPLNETVVSYGPFVMNTKEEINQCIRNYNSGAMGDPMTVN